jgi:hypothetical protein
MKVAIIGGGAAGFFAAIAVKENYPHAEVILFEKGKKVLSKVKVSGGGRCNVTNGTSSIKALSAAYPRGGKQLKKAFSVFNTVHCRKWFEDRGVALKEESDGRVFPVSDNSQTIIDCFLHTTQRLGIEIQRQNAVIALRPLNNQFELTTSTTTQLFDKVIVASGGSPKLSGLEWLSALGHQIEPPVPSLFTFNMPKEAIRELMGVSVKEVALSIQGHKLQTNGALLITHWGMSGPAVLKLSAFAARDLHQMNYRFQLQVNWTAAQNHELVKTEIDQLKSTFPAKQLANQRPYQLPERIWLYLLDRYNIPARQKWSELSKKHSNILLNALTHDIYQVEGKTTFKEEFVTCGGVSLNSIDFKTMQSKACPGLYFCGEVLDIDGITGGYNFQAAWTTAFIAAKLN